MWQVTSPLQYLQGHPGYTTRYPTDCCRSKTEKKRKQFIKSIFKKKTKWRGTKGGLHLSSSNNHVAITRQARQQGSRRPRLEIPEVFPGLVEVINPPPNLLQFSGIVLTGSHLIKTPSVVAKKQTEEEDEEGVGMSYM